MRNFRIVVVGLFWLLCMAGGLWVGEVLAPEPVVLVIPLEVRIDNDATTYAEEKLAEAVTDPAVAAVVLSVDSPGGGSVAGELIYRAVLQTRQSKPVVVFVSGIAMSAGYLISVASDAIYAPAMSEVGNIGTRAPRPGDPIFVGDQMLTGPYKANDARFDTIRRLELDTDTFASAVLYHRQTAPNPLSLTLAELREGRSYLGREALALGLIDAIGGRGDALDAAAALAGLRNYRTAEAEPFPDWYDQRYPDYWQASEEMTPTPIPAEGE